MRKKLTQKKSPPFISIWAALALALMWSLAGCTLPLRPPPSEPVPSVQLQPLPAWARQPETPSECLPTCLDALTSERGFWQTSLTDATSPVAPASVSTTTPGKN